ncbi:MULTISPECIES: hypothetical protein [unclassified Rhodanobacter]|uniref:DUF2158 domain-containing protein n=1 Tax=Rhodanobacter humi TaxID=1888173 RepID=A0ABV4AQJ2_9GAMM
MANRNEFQTGDRVRVRTFGGDWVERIVVAVEHGKVFVSTSQGFAALMRGEASADIGFPMRDVEQAATT